MAPLSPDQVDSYHKQGFLLLQNLISPHLLAEVSEEYDELFRRQAAGGGRMEARWGGDWDGEEGGGSVLSIHNLQQHSAVFTRLLLDPGLAEVLGQIVGTSVVLHHTKAHLKPPKEGAPFPTHQDFHYFPYSKHSMLAVFIHLDDTAPENGGLGVFPGSHLKGPQRDAGTSKGIHHCDQTEWPMSEAMPVTAKAGDVLIFSYLLVHGSFPNLSDKTRRMFLIQVASGEDRPQNSAHRSPGAGLVLWGRNTSVKADLDNRHIKVDQRKEKESKEETE